MLQTNLTDVALQNILHSLLDLGAAREMLIFNIRKWQYNRNPSFSVSMLRDANYFKNTLKEVYLVLRNNWCSRLYLDSHKNTHTHTPHSIAVESSELNDQ